MLFRVFLAADSEVQRAPARGHLLSAGFDRQRDADDGQPSRALFLDHQHRFALIGGSRRLSASAQINYGNATGHRFVECAGDETVGVGGQTQEQGEQRGNKT